MAGRHFDVRCTPLLSTSTWKIDGVIVVGLDITERDAGIPAPAGRGWAAAQRSQRAPRQVPAQLAPPETQ